MMEQRLGSIFGGVRKPLLTLDKEADEIVPANPQTHWRTRTLSLQLAAAKRADHMFADHMFHDMEQVNQLILRAAGEGIYGLNADGITIFVKSCCGENARLDRRGTRWKGYAHNSSSSQRSRRHFL